jgi:protein-tyrosine-phosphatase
LAIDGGSCSWGKESSIVDLTVEPAQILREGAIKKEEIEAVIRKKNVLFICTGNTCRSVMAAVLLEKMLRERKRDDVQVMSAGLLLLPGMGVTGATREVLIKEGIDVSEFHSQKVSRDMIKKADLILVMEKIHEEHILRLAPEVKNRVFLLKEFAKINDDNLEIIDPIGKPVEAYVKTLDTVKDALQRIIELI